MDAFIKAVRSPIHRPFSLSSKHKKLPDKWGDYQHQDKIWDGVIFHVKYLGNTLVMELDEEGQSYGDSISADAVKSVVAMAKASGKKLPKMSILVSPRGICVTNTETQQVFTDLDIHRICFCTADRDHPKVFAYIARNRENETMECQAFLCSKRKVAEAVTLTVAESFKLAQEKWEEEEKRMKERQELAAASQGAVETAASDSEHKKMECDQGFDDNFSDLPVLSGPIRSLGNPFKASNFTTTITRNDVDVSVITMSRGFPTSPDCNMSRGFPINPDYDMPSCGLVPCKSPSSADELLCL